MSQIGNRDPGLVGAALALGVCAIGLAYSLPHWPVLGRRLDVRLAGFAAAAGKADKA